MLRKIVIGFAILFLLLVGAGVYLYLKVQPILHEAEARQKMLQPRWKKEESNVWHVETLDTNGDGREEILQSDAKGELLVRNGNGDVIARYLPNFYVSHFALTRWGEEERASHILIPISESHEGCCKQAFILLDANGKKGCGATIATRRFIYSDERNTNTIRERG